MDGFSLAFGEITLVLFTTLAPSGAVAYLIMGLPVLVGRAQDEVARRLPCRALRYRQPAAAQQAGQGSGTHTE